MQKGEKMPKVHIIGDFYFVQDPFQYILYRKQNDNSKRFGAIIGYYQSLDKMLLKVIEQIVKDETDSGQIDTVQSYLDAMNKVVDRIKTEINK